MDWPFVIAAVVAGWAVLSVLGGERQRRLDDVARAAAAVVQAAPPDATVTPHAGH